MGLNIDKLKSEASRFVVPAKAFSDILIGTTEKISDQQFKSCQAYSSIYFSQLKKVPDIQNLGDAGSFFWDQIEPFSEFNKQLLNDWKTVVGLNSDFISEAKAVFTPQKAVPKAKKPAAKKSAPSKKEPVSTAAATKTEEKPKSVTKITRSRASASRKTTSASTKP